MPVWLKLVSACLCLNALILGMGIYSDQKLREAANFIEQASSRIADVGKSVDHAVDRIENVSSRIDDVNKSINDTSALAQDVYHKPLQSINFARTAQNDFTVLDFTLYKSYQTGTLDNNQEDINDGFDLFKENFEIAEERSISPHSLEEITAIKSLAAKWNSLKDGLIEGRNTYDEIENVSKDLQNALANLVEFEAGAGYDFVLASEKTTEKAHQVSKNMKDSAIEVLADANSIRLSAQTAQSTVQGAIKDARQVRQANRILTIIAFIGSIIVVGVLTFNIVRPVKLAQKTAESIAHGNLDNEIASNRNDEFGKLLNAMAAMQEDLRKNIAIEQDAKHQAEQTALSSQNRQKKLSTLLDRLSNEIDAIMQTSKQSIQDIQGTADSLAETAQSSKQNSDSVTTDINQVSGAVTTIASAVEQLSASIQEISSKTTQSSQTAKEAVRQAGEAKDAVKNLSEMSNEVGEIISLINDIAEQTNLLALNATIEAARAGEAGKGFAVVASEVKSLATETAKATEQISSQISGIQGISDQCVHAIEKIIETIDYMQEASNSIDIGMNDQKAATSEISEQSHRTSSRMNQAAANMNEVTDAVGTVQQSSALVLHSIQSINEEMDKMDRNVKTITNEIRANS